MCEVTAKAALSKLFSVSFQRPTKLQFSIVAQDRQLAGVF
jgi:hypothetical protein